MKNLNKQQLEATKKAFRKYCGPQKTEVHDYTWSVLLKELVNVGLVDKREVKK